MEDALVGSVLGKYKIESLLGQGGMGKVYRAFDTQLDRPVALKFVRSDDGEILERFMREARHQARVDHENICKIYEVGDLDGKPFIALQLVEGSPIKPGDDRLTLEEKVMIVRDVADAIQSAHALGLIHRDLKPGNIMIRQAEDGRWIPTVLDFGLARELAAPGLTISGMVLGSPAYMSPEQALGDIAVMDRRSDIYSLGVTLYEMLCGERPFPGTAITELLIQVVEEEPRPLRQAAANMPGDLENIVMKCLEKEQERRYDSARLLARDLTNFLHGDPVAAKSTSIFYRVSKKIRKNKLMSAVIGVFMVTGVILLSLAIQARSQARQQARLAQKFGQDIERVERLIQHGYLLPLHDTRREKHSVLEQLTAIEKEMTRFGIQGEASGHYALGRGFASLHDYENALPHFQSAWDKDYQTPEVAFHLGQALGHIYKERMEALLSTEDDPAVMAEQRSVLERDYRDRALHFLKLGLDWGGMAKEYTAALISFHEGRFEDAANYARQVFSLDPGLYLSKTLEGDIFMRWGLESKSRGDLEGALKYYKDAGLCYEAAQNIARSDPTLYESESFRLGAMMEVAIERGSSAVEMYHAAREAGGQGLQADPDSFTLHNRLSELNWNWCNYLLDKGEDTDGSCERAIELGERALELKPGNTDGHLALGFTYLQIGYQNRVGGKDPRPALEKAADHAGEAIKTSPNHIRAHNCLGVAMLVLGTYDAEDGQNPLPSLNLAVETFLQILKIDPKDPTGYMNLGITHLGIAEYRSGRGRSARDDLQKALSYFNTGIEMDPSQTFYYLCRGKAHLELGVNQLITGQDPGFHFTSAREAFLQGIERNQNYAYNEQWLGRLFFWSAIWASDSGQDATPLFKDSETHLKKAIELNPQFMEFYRDLGETYLEWARALGWGPLAENLQDKAFEMMDKTDELSGVANSDINRLQGLIHLLPLELGERADEEAFDLSLAHLKKAVSLNDASEKNWTALAHVYLVGGRAFQEQTAIFGEEALTAITKALEINPISAEAWFIKSKLPGQSKEEIRAAMLQAARLNPVKYGSSS